jgi:peptidylprolyl isomerase
MRIPVKAAFVAAAVAVALPTAACSNSERDAPASAMTESAPVGGGPAAAGRQCTVDDITVTGTAGQKPTITIPANCSPPSQLLTKDLSGGTGATVKPGDHVEVNYDLVSWSDRTEQDTSWKGGSATPFPVDNIGQAKLIQGWNEGLIGAKQGGRRLLVVPPDKGYPNGAGPIKPGETLVFVIDVVKTGR